MIAYIKVISDYGKVYYMRLNPTGKWAFQTGPNCSDKKNGDLYIQHKGRIFKKWIHENSIKFLDCDETYTEFYCKDEGFE